jgi:hypothetical protein
MDISEVYRIIGDEKKLIDFINTKTILNRAHEFWMEVFHANRDKHRKFLTQLLKNDN